MELSQLRYFLKAAELENFTRAAEELHVTQPALSRAIAKLEEELGQPLFERQARHVVLTHAGHLLAARARQVIALVEDTREELADDGQTGTLRIGAIPTIAPYFLPQVLGEFARQKPHATLVVVEDITANLLKQTLDGDVDVAIVALPIAAEHLEVETLFQEELFLVLPPGHPLVLRRRITIEDVEPYPVVLLSQGHCLSDSVLTLCRNRSFQPITVGRTTQLATVQEIVSLGHGVSLIPRMARILDTSNSRVYRSFCSPPPTRTVAMTWNPYRFQRRLLADFKDALRSVEPTQNSVRAAR